MTWRTTRNGEIGIARTLQRAQQRTFDFLQSIGIDDRRAVFFEDMVEVDAIAVVRRCDARIDDVMISYASDGGGVGRRQPHTRLSRGGPWCEHAR
ncbi:MAG: hypothetical protein EBY86_02460 [Acidimicrobiia bacterium]|nr:hypothetical protein [Acidimicrobiia bacterium]